MKIKQFFIIIFAIAVFFGIVGVVVNNYLIDDFFAPTEQVNVVNNPPALTSTAERPETTIPILIQPEVFATNLDVPWEIDFLPTGELILTERSGVLKIIGAETTAIPVPEAQETAEGGLLGLALHPNFASNNWLYLYYTAKNKNGETINRVVRYILEDDEITTPVIIIDEIPGGSVHDGGRMTFGPDGLLYIATGDAREASLAQDTNSLAGKVLRVTDRGQVPASNPFDNEVFSYGHRNIQGLAFDQNNVLWATEHGRSGITSGLDELNKIEIGKNYGWPTIEGDEIQAGMVTPVLHSGPDVTWAPADLVIVDSVAYFAGLRGQSIYQVSLTNPTAALTNYFELYGRLRAITEHQGWLYFASSNRDGRGNPEEGDDIIYRVRLDGQPTETNN